MPESSNPFTTGAVARLLTTTEPRVAETVRRGYIKPEPTIVAGRRLWTYEQILQAAEVLGVLDTALRERIDAAFGIATTTRPDGTQGAEVPS